MSDDAITTVANLINTSGHNRSQRRRLERSLAKVENIQRHTQEHVDRSMYKEYEKAVDSNFLHFFSVLTLTLAEDYHWKEDETHNQITSMLTRVGKNLDKYANQGLTTEELVKLVDDKYGITLIAEGN